MTILEVKRNKDKMELNLYYSKIKKRQSFYRKIIDNDYNNFVQLLFDLLREGYPVERASRELIRRVENKEWLF